MKEYEKDEEYSLLLDLIDSDFCTELVNQRSLKLTKLVDKCRIYASHLETAIETKDTFYFNFFQSSNFFNFFLVKLP